jgi:hypothetical protein
MNDEITNLESRHELPPKMGPLMDFCLLLKRLQKCNQPIENNVFITSSNPLFLPLFFAPPPAAQPDAKDSRISSIDPIPDALHPRVWLPAGGHFHRCSTQPSGVGW